MALLFRKRSSIFPSCSPLCSEVDWHGFETASEASPIRVMRAQTSHNRTGFFFFCTLVTGPRRSLSLKLSDTRVYEPASVTTTLTKQDWHRHCYGSCKLPDWGGKLDALLRRGRGAGAGH
jgi:hypothetical protein